MKYWTPTNIYPKSTSLLQHASEVSQPQVINIVFAQSRDKNIDTDGNYKLAVFPLPWTVIEYGRNILLNKLLAQQAGLIVD